MQDMVISVTSRRRGQELHKRVLPIVRLEAIASSLEAIAIRLEAIAIRLLGY